MSVAVGVNIHYTGRGRIRGKIARLLGFHGNALRGSPSKPKFCYGVADPSDSTQEDNPNAKGDLYYQYTNGRVFVCTTATDDGSGTDWTRLV